MLHHKSAATPARTRHVRLLTPLTALTLAVWILAPAPARAATPPSTVASLAAPNASDSPAPAPPASAASARAKSKTTPIPAPRGGSAADQSAMVKAAAEA